MMRRTIASLPVWVKETLIVSLTYFVVFIATFEVITPVQNLFFPEFGNQASLLFLPSGVRVLSAWLLGWRSILAMAPGVFMAFYYLLGINVFDLSRIIAILIAIVTPAVMFWAFKLIWPNISPQSDQKPCWPCVMVVGISISIVGSLLVNYVSGNSSIDYFAYIIGDLFGLLFLMMAMMYCFRFLRKRRLKL